MNAISLNEKNWLWYFYCKEYTLHGREVPPPKNLCRFWWLAVSGLISWIGLELRLLYIWGVTAVATILLYALGYAFPDGGTIVMVVAFPLSTFWLVALLGSMYVPGIRLYRLVDKKIPWLLPTLGAILMLALVVAFFMDGEMRAEMLEGAPKFFAMVFGSVGALFLLLVLGYFILPRLADMLPYRWMDGAEGTFWTSVFFFKAKKQGVCPTVHPPESYLAEHPEPEDEWPDEEFE